MEFRVIRSDADGLVTGSAGNPLVPISFQERAHSSSIANYFDFGRSLSTDVAEEPEATEAAEELSVEPGLDFPAAREPELPVPRRAESPPVAPATETPS